MTCERCGRSDLGEIAFDTMASGITFRFCRSCEHRWWTTPAEGIVDLDGVLQAATVFARAS